MFMDYCPAATQRPTRPKQSGDEPPTVPKPQELRQNLDILPWDEGRDLACQTDFDLTRDPTSCKSNNLGRCE